MRLVSRSVACESQPWPNCGGPSHNSPAPRRPGGKPPKPIPFRVEDLNSARSSLVINIIQQHNYFVPTISRLGFWNGSGLEGPVARPPPKESRYLEHGNLRVSSPCNPAGWEAPKPGKTRRELHSLGIVRHEGHLVLLLRTCKRSPTRKSGEPSTLVHQAPK